ncbi:hexose transporter [Xylogone sp. PMI_703]|nr:hexose transporter [Xylogone sp. PMI_703]
MSSVLESAAPQPPTRSQPGKWWWQDAGLRRLYLLILVAILSSATNGYDGSMMNGLQTLVYWRNYFNNPEGATLGLLNAIQSVGSICSLPYAPYLADAIGRKRTILFGSCFVALGVALQTGAQNIGMFIAGRFFIGHGSSVTIVASPLLITELCHPSQRGKVTAIFNTFWYFGSLIAAWTTYGTLRILNDWSWRLPSMLQAVPSLLQLTLIWWLPESPRFLVSKERYDEALNIMAKYHANGDCTDEWLRFEFAEIRSSIESEKQSKNQGWKALIATPGNRRRVLICICCGMFSQLSGNGLIGYYLNKILDLLGYTDPFFQNKINGIYAATNWVEAMVSALMVDYIGRRPLFLASNGSMVITFALWIAFTAVNINTNSAQYGVGAIVMMFLHTLVYNLVWVSLNVAYPVEILPYHLRAKGLTIFSFSVSLSLFFGQYVNPVGIQNLGWKYYIVYEVWLVIELLVVIAIFVETRGSTIEEMAILFDGKDQVEQLRTRALEKKLEDVEAEVVQVEDIRSVKQNHP